MKAGRIATLVASALLAAATAATPALSRPDPSTGVRGAGAGPTVLVTPTSAVTPETAAGDEFDWADAAIGAAIALGAAGIGACAVRLVRIRPSRQPLASR